MQQVYQRHGLHNVKEIRVKRMKTKEEEGQRGGDVD